MPEKHKHCDRCKQILEKVWFHKVDEFEDCYICLDCYEKEYGPYEQYAGVE